MSTDSQVNKANTILKQFQNSAKPEFEVYVNGLGWLVFLRESIELVSDNWFASAKYSASVIVVSDHTIKCKNVYQHNENYSDRLGNAKFNLIYDELSICSDQIVAFY